MKARARLDIALRPALAALALSLLVGAAGAQDESEQDRGYVAVVTQDATLVLAGAHDSFYPFARLDADALVRVVGQKDRWARVATVGPAFAKSFGYIRYHRDEPGRMSVAGDGRSAVTMGETEVLAPNLNEGGSPGASWKALVRLAPDTTVRVLETSRTDREIIHKVALPPRGVGWISMASLRRATPAEVDQWQAALAEVSAEATLPAEILARDESPGPIVTNPGGDAGARPLDDGRSTILPLPDVAAGGGGVGGTRPTAPAAPAAPASAQPEPTAAAPTVAQAPAGAGPSAALMADGNWEAALERLEEAFAQLKGEPIETAEVTPLRGLYEELAERSEKQNVARFAASRVEQLAIWAELQERRQDLKVLRASAQSAAAEAGAVRLALEQGGPYVGVGRLMVSSIYDGRVLPRLLRLQDPTSGRTVAYLQPGDHDDLDALLGQMVGIVGTKEYDGGLRVNLITPERIEPLSPVSQVSPVS